MEGKKGTEHGHHKGFRVEGLAYDAISSLGLRVDSG